MPAPHRAVTAPTDRCRRGPATGRCAADALAGGPQPGRGALALDDTGRPKQGKPSVGVARQYSGTLGKVGNCQVVVSAEYVPDVVTAGSPAHWPVTAQLYRPQSWADGQERRRRAHVPPAVGFATRPGLALVLVDRARDWGVPWGWVRADAAYGNNPGLGEGVAERKLRYLVGVEQRFGVRLPEAVAAVAAAGPPPYPGKGRPPKVRPAPLPTAEAMAAGLREDQWQTVTWREGTLGPLQKQFAAVRVHWATCSPATTNTERRNTSPEGWLLLARPRPGHQGETKDYPRNAPADTTRERLAHWPMPAGPVRSSTRMPRGSVGGTTTRGGGGTVCTAT
ncbi:MAG: IS701 family transposase [Chloroflexi bacterium]|nr:IS701 family transposase [Chloroflexota bacterium]